MIPTKILVIGSAIIVITLVGWQYTRQAEKIGKLEQSNTTLVRAVQDSEKNYNNMKNLVALTASEVIKVEKQKSVLNNYALKKVYELEILKNENEDIKKWAISFLPDLISNRLLDFSNYHDTDRLSNPSIGVDAANTGTSVIIKNETLYQYAIDAITGLRSCNADKLGVLNFYKLKGVKQHVQE